MKCFFLHYLFLMFTLSFFCGCCDEILGGWFLFSQLVSIRIWTEDRWLNELCLLMFTLCFLWLTWWIVTVGLNELFFAYLHNFGEDEPILLAMLTNSKWSKNPCQCSPRTFFGRWTHSLLTVSSIGFLTTGFSICWPCWRVPIKAFSFFSIRHMRSRASK